MKFFLGIFTYWLVSKPLGFFCGLFGIGFVLFSLNLFSYCASFLSDCSHSPLRFYLIISITNKKNNNATMEVAKITPTSTCFFQVKLELEIIDYLWKIIDSARLNEVNHKRKLIENVSKSLLLDDKEFFYKTVCMPLFNFYRQSNLV